MRLCTLAPITALLALAAPALAGAADPVPEKTVAYATFTSSAKPPAVWATPNGAKAVRLATNAFGPVVSPRGDLVAYTASTSSSYRLIVAHAGGGVIRTLASDAGPGTPVWSPDQSKIAVVVGPEIGKQTLALFDVATGTRTVIAKGYFSGASFSPDGTQLAYSSVAKSTLEGVGGDVYVATLSTMASGKPVNITRDGTSVSPLWGPQSIAISHLTKSKKKEDYPKANLQTIQPDGSGRKTLTKLKIPYLLSGLTATAWSADGQRLLAEYGGQDYSEAWTVDLSTGKARDLTGKADGVVGYGLSGDGNTVLAGTGGYDVGSNDADVVTYAFTGKNKKILVKKANSASWAGF